MTGLVLLHGWGYSSEVFEGWRAAFPERPVELLDAGYFGAPRLDLPPNEGGWVGVGHSLGFAKLLGMDVPWRGLVGFGAFLRFCELPGKTGGTPQALMEAMLARLADNPADVLRRFVRRCGDDASCAPPLDESGLQRLREDLLLLRGLDMQPPAQVPPLLLVHAADDRIVSPALAREAQGGLRRSRFKLFESGGHVLPFKHPQPCQALVREFLNGL